MSCIIRKDNKIEVLAPNGASSLLYGKIKTLGKSEKETLKIYNTLRVIDFDNLDSNGEPNLSIGGKSIHFDNLLVALASKDISIQSMNDYNKEYELRTGNKLEDNVLGVTDTVNNIIAFSKGNTSIQEESVHMGTATEPVLTSAPMKRLMAGVDINTNEGKDYMKLYKDEKLVRKELADHMIMDYILNESTFTGRIKNNIKGVIAWIKKVFGNPQLAPLIKDIANQITSPEFELGKIIPNQLQFMLEENDLDEDNLDDLEGLDDFKDFQEKYIKGLTERINQFGNFAEIKHRDKLIQNLRNGRKDLFLINTVNDIQKRVTDGYERLQSIVKQKDPQKNEVAIQLRKLQDTFEFYGPQLKAIREVNLDNKKLKSEIDTTIAKLDEFETKFLKVRRMTLGHILVPYFSDYVDKDGKEAYRTYEDIEPLLLQAEELVPWEAWLSALADASDDLLKAIDQYVKDTHNVSETKSKKEIKKLFSLGNKLGSKDFSKFFQKVDGKLGNYLLNRYDTEKHDIARDKMLTSARDTYLISHDNKDRKLQFIDGTTQNRIYGELLVKQLKAKELPFTLYEKDGKKEIEVTYDWLADRLVDNQTIESALIDRVHRAYKQSQAKWFSENNQAIDNVNEEVSNHFNRMIDQYLIGDMRKHKTTIKKFYKAKELVIDENLTINYLIGDLESELESMGIELINDARQEIYSTLYRIKNWQDNSIGIKFNGEIYFKFDLSRPSDVYYNTSYDELDDDEKNFLDYIKDIKRKNLDMKYVHNLDLAPQMYKGVQERLESVDALGFLKSIKEELTVNEDDTEFGSRKPGIPIFFQAKINAEDMSRDLLTTMAAYIAMANHHVEFSKVEEVLNMVQDQVSSRDVVKKELEVYTDEDGKRQTREIFVKTGKKGGNSSKRVDTYIDMVVRKKTKAEETWLPPKWIKRIDKFMNWVSLNALGGNVYSGVANIFTSAATRLQEIAASKFLGTLKDGSYRKAAAIYVKYGIKNLMDYGTANTDNPFTIMSQFMGIMDDFNQELVMNDEGKNRVLNAIKKLPFAPNTIGEHAVAHNTALAIMDNIELLKNGKPITLLDAMMIVKDGQPDFNGLTTLGGQPYTAVMARKAGRAINRQNQVLFGIYNEIDQTAASQFVLGRAVGQFRKFFIPGLYRRWQHSNFDFQLGIQREGMYRTSLSMMKRIAIQAKEDRTALLSITQKEWENLSLEQKKNIIRSGVELTSIALAVVFGAILTKASEDDEDNDVLAFMAYQANRHYREMSTFGNPFSFLEIMKSPAAAVSQLETVGSILTSIDPIGAIQGEDLFSKYKDGTGESKIGRNAFNLVPGIKAYKRFVDPQGQFNMTK